VYHKLDGFVPRTYQPILRTHARTRSQHRPWYDLHQPTPATQLPQDLYPVTIENDASLTGSLFQVNISATTIVEQTLPPPTQYLNLGDYLTEQPPLSVIAEALQKHNLTIVCSSNYDAEQKLATSTCSFLSTTIIYEYESQPMSNTSRYRAELFSILLGLYILHSVEQSSPRTERSTAIITSNSKQALKQAFGSSPIGIRRAIRANYDLVLEIAHFRKTLTRTLSTYHGPVQNGGLVSANPSKPILEVHKLSGACYQVQQPLYSHVVTVLHKGEPVLANLQQLVQDATYHQPLQQKLQKDNNWTDEQFSLVDWVLIKGHSRSARDPIKLASPN
jgi:hypothetical protein